MPDPRGRHRTYVARPGGNALNVAVAAGRLGTPVRLMARLGTGPLAANLRRHAELSGVDPGGFVDGRRAGEPGRRRPRRRTARPTTASTSSAPPTGSGPTTSWPTCCASGTAILHVGSISSWTAPGCEAIARLVERLHAGSVLISVDPNIRPMLADGPGRDDAGQLRGDRPRAAGPAARPGRRREGQRRGPRLAGARRDVRRRPGRDRPAVGRARARAGAASPTAAHRSGSPGPGTSVRHWRTPQVTVVDTVGAGDSLAAGLLAGLLESGVTDRAALEALPDEDLLRLVDDAALVAALNCTRVGADPPTRAEFDRRPRRTVTTPDDVRRRRLRRAVRHGGPRAPARRARPVLGRRHPGAAPPGVVPPVRRASARWPGRRAGRTSATSSAS